MLNSINLIISILFIIFLPVISNINLDDERYIEMVEDYSIIPKDEFKILAYDHGLLKNKNYSNMNQKGV